jgi:hypothetical protein
MDVGWMLDVSCNIASRNHQQPPEPSIGLLLLLLFVFPDHPTSSNLDCLPEQARQ